MSYRTVLIENNRMMLERLSSVIRNSPGFELSARYQTAGDALGQMQAFSPNLILLDIDMPEMKGTEVAKLINEKYDYQIPILFVSALSDVETVLTCRQLKAAGYIVRPYQPFYVLSEVRRILEGQEAY